MGYGTEQPLRLCLAQTGPSGYRRAASDGSRSSVTIAPSASRSGTADSISSLKHILKISPATRLARRGIYDGIPGILSEAKHHPRFHSRTLVRTVSSSINPRGVGLRERAALADSGHMPERARVIADPVGHVGRLSRGGWSLASKDRSQNPCPMQMPPPSPPASPPR